MFARIDLQLPDLPVLRGDASDVKILLEHIRQMQKALSTYHDELNASGAVRLECAVLDPTCIQLFDGPGDYWPGPITLDSAQGESFVSTITAGTAFTMNAPTNPEIGRRLVWTGKNNSGGALGVITWNAVFKQAWVSPANGFNRSIMFRYDGLNWVELWHGPADVPN